MIMYVVTALIFVMIFINYFLGAKLYKEPKNEAYFSNVKHYNVIQQRDIMTAPQYTFVISALLGFFIGMYLILGKVTKTNDFIMGGTVCVLLILYLIDITRKIMLTDDMLVLERLFFRTKKIPLEQIDGLYVYSLNKKFLHKNAFTTKLVITTGSSKYKYTLSGIDTRAVLNMMKDNFGITENRIFVAQKG